MNLLRITTSVYLASVIGLTLSAAEAGSVVPIQTPEAVHAVTVDLPQFPSLSHVSPSTWHTLPPPPAPRSGLNGHAPILFAWSSELTGD